MRGLHPVGPSNPKPAELAQQNVAVPESTGPEKGEYEGNSGERDRLLEERGITITWRSDTTTKGSVQVI